MRRRVLVVEDDEDILDLLKTVVLQEGCGWRAARSAAEACRLCDEERFDVILLDPMLPDAYGLEVARHARRKKRKPAIVIVSAAEPAELDRTVSRKLGIRKVIHKPYRVEDIRDALRGK